MNCPYCHSSRIVVTSRSFVPMQAVTVGSTDMQLVQRADHACFDCHSRWYVHAAPVARVTIRKTKEQSETVIASSQPGDHPLPNLDPFEERTREQSETPRESRKSSQNEVSEETKRRSRKKPSPKGDSVTPSSTTRPAPNVVPDMTGFYVRVPTSREVVNAAQGIADLLAAATDVVDNLRRVGRVGSLGSGRRRGR